MSEHPYKVDFNDLPEQIPIIPLHGVLLLPRGKLPLNIFEERYLELLEDVMRSRHRLIGMVQPASREDEHSVYKTGCAGKITSYQETEDGRNLITLTGLCRFTIVDEVYHQEKYRRVRVRWQDYKDDLQTSYGANIDRNRLIDLLHTYFDIHDLTCDWELVEKSPDERLITSLSMICPLDACEKQVLLEAPCCKERAEKFMAMLEIAVKSQDTVYNNGICH
jgi:hypothetical protein